MEKDKVLEMLNLVENDNSSDPLAKVIIANLTVIIYQLDKIKEALEKLVRENECA